MEIFNNMSQPNYERILSYGPKWLAEYREMDANYRFSGWTLDLSAFFLERIIENLFPETADEPTILMFERIMNIEYDEPNITLDERRRTVAAYYYGIGKLNRTSILNMAKKYTGRDCALKWRGSLLVIYTTDDLENEEELKFEYSRLAKILNRRMPAHLGFSFQDIIKGLFAFNRNENVSVGITYQISWRLDGTYLLDGEKQLKAEEERVTLQMADGVLTTIAAKKMLLARAGIAPVDKIVGMAFGDGAMVGNVVSEPSPAVPRLKNELYRQQIDGYEVVSDMCIRYTCTLSEEVLNNVSINEMALYDEAGDIVAIKTFHSRNKGNDMAIAFEVDDTFFKEG